MTPADFLRADWGAPACIIAGTTLRTGGVSEGVFESLNLGDHVGDDPEAVAENRRRVRATLELPGEPVWLRQVHGTAVVTAGPSASGAEADASVASAGNVVLAIMTADCLPVLFSTRDGSRIAAAHAGWRGLVAGVLENTLNALAVPPRDVLAWLGPGISAPAFEVGEEVRTAFLANGAVERHFEPNASGRWQADLYGIARQRLQQAGVAQVTGGAYCTSLMPERFFSYRRDGECGRMASIIFRRDG